MSSGASTRSLSRLNHDISEITVERTLKQLLDEGYIQKFGGGRGTTYAKRM